MRYAGHALTGLGGAAAGALVASAMQEPSLNSLNAGKPSHQHYMTQIGHAQNNAARGWTDLSDEDYAVVEGVRQALMGDRMTSDDVRALAAQGVITDQQYFYLGDVLG